MFLGFCLLGTFKYLRTLNSTINPVTRTARLLNVNQNERTCWKERETSLSIVNTVFFMGLSHFFRKYTFFWRIRNSAFTHLCSYLASLFARTFVCLRLCAKELFSHAYVHTRNVNRHSSPMTRVQKTASRASATNGQPNDATNDETNMWLVHSSFALLLASPLARMCKCSIIQEKTIRRFMVICQMTIYWDKQKTLYSLAINTVRIATTRYFVLLKVVTVHKTV